MHDRETSQDPSPDGDAPDPFLSARRPRRHYSELQPGRFRDRDSESRAQLLRAGAVSGGGAVLGYFAGWFLARRVARPELALLLPLVSAVVVGLGVFVFGFAISRLAGWAAGRLHHPGGSGSARREYSQPEAMAAQGRHREAVAFFELAASENPDDPAPYLRAARIYRDSLAEPEEALRCFRHAREARGVTDAQWRAVTRELVELIRGPLGQPGRAAPELARLAERGAGTEDGAWAIRELAEVKKRIASEGG
jgi:tetratricopeptide (TPR) repeat protein